jgi:hypothetical protein
MGTFAKQVFNAFKGMSFTPSTATASNDFAALLRREHETVCSYIYARDDRRGNGPVAVHYWIAPPDFPDDGLDNLGVGYKIPMVSTFMPDDTFFSVARARVENVVGAATALSEAVMNECKAPSSVTSRLIAYREQVTLYDIVMRIGARGDNAEMVSVIERANEAVKAGRSYRAFSSECQRLAEILKSRKVEFPPEHQRFLERPQLMLQTMLSRHIYVEALVPFKTL